MGYTLWEKESRQDRPPHPNQFHSVWLMPAGAATTGQNESELDDHMEFAVLALAWVLHSSSEQNEDRALQELGACYLKASQLHWYRCRRQVQGIASELPEPWNHSSGQKARTRIGRPHLWSEDLRKTAAEDWRMFPKVMDSIEKIDIQRG